MELEIAGNEHTVARELHQRGLSRSNQMHGYHCDCEKCHDYFGEDSNWFKVQSDSSCGGEIISSPLSFKLVEYEPDPLHLFNQLEEVLGPPNNVPINDLCAVHIHVDVQDLTDRQLGRLYELVHHYEAVLFRLACGRARQHRGYNNNFEYCRPLSAFENQLEVKELAMAKSEAVKKSPIARQKYVAANLMPVDRLGTVEFRLWESTRMAWRMELFAKLSVAMVQRATSKRAPAGEPLHLGDTADDELVIEAFLWDLEQSAPELVTEEFKALVMEQWSNGPGWQAAQRFRPLPHYDRNENVLAEGSTADVLYSMDTHGHLIYHDTDVPVPARVARLRSQVNREPASYEEAYDLVDDPEPLSEDEMAAIIAQAVEAGVPVVMPSGAVLDGDGPRITRAIDAAERAARRMREGAW